jgi:hypothetical protein
MTDPERATIREVIASMRGRARLQIGQHEAIHRADIAKLEALVRSSDHEDVGAAASRSADGGTS